MNEVSRNFSVEDFYSASGLLRALTLDSSDFEIKRIYWISKVPHGEIRGMHAHKHLRQIFICLSGQLSVKFDDGIETNVYVLTEKDSCITVEPGLWRELYDFSQDSMLMVLCDEVYDEQDYIRDYEEFILWKATKCQP